MNSNASLQVIVDDRSPNITLKGRWVDGGWFQEYNSTTLQSGSKGSTLTLHFEGTSVAAYGTLGYGNSSKQTYSVDGSPASWFTSHPQYVPQFHQELFSATGLKDGPHTLLVTQQSTLPDVNIYIDYFLVTSSESELAEEMVFYDDASPAFTYTGNWSTGVGTDEDLQSTLHGAETVGSTASLAFNGSFISIFGNIPQNSSGSIATFSVDGSMPLTVSVPLDLCYAEGNVSNQVLYAVALEPGNHSLRMTAAAPNIFFLDYITVQAYPYSNSTTPSPSTTSSTQSTSLATSSLSSSPSSATLTPSSSPSSLASYASSHVGTIIGAATGGIVLIAALITLFLFLRLRHRHVSTERPFQASPYREMFASEAPATFQQEGPLAIPRPTATSEIVGPSQPSQPRWVHRRSSDAAYVVPDIFNPHARSFHSGETPSTSVAPMNTDPSHSLDHSDVSFHDRATGSLSVYSPTSQLQVFDILEGTLDGADSTPQSPVSRTEQRI